MFVRSGSDAIALSEERNQQRGWFTNMARFKVHFTGGEGINWALDHDIQHLRKLSQDFVDVVPLHQAEIVHTVFWHALMSIPEKHLAGKKVVASIADKPQIIMSRPEYLTLRDRVSMWLCEYYDSLNFVSNCGLPCMLFPDPIDVHQFAPPESRQESVASLKARLGIPADRYLIGNFHRDSSGTDLSLPKKQKGADVLLEVATILHRMGLPVHFLLAGPRRHWLRRGFKERGIPYTFMGREVPEDDLKENTLSLDDVAALYRGLDAYAIASRWEGAPNSVLECAASKTKVISTRVGQSPDILMRGQLFDNAADGAELLARDLRDNYLASALEAAYEQIHKFNTYPAIGGRLKYIYEQLSLTAPADNKTRAEVTRSSNAGAWLARWSRTRPVQQANDETRVRRRVASDKALTFALWNDFRPPPYGGGNQFMIALEGALQRRGMAVKRNSGVGADAHVIQSIWFDRAQFDREREPGSVVIHRIDGPIQLYRGNDAKSDALCYELNRELADATVMQSGWSMVKTFDLGFKPFRPVLMWNSCDPVIFNRNGRKPFDRNRKVRLISTSWSDNPRKGRDTYRWLDENLDWTRYEYTFVGRIQETFKHIRVQEPVDSVTLAGILKDHDVFITASQQDPCSNALVEALSCGLPAVYFNDGGHPELVEMGGLGFRASEEIPAQLDRIVKYYESFQANIWVDSMDELADKYIAIARQQLD